MPTNASGTSLTSYKHFVATGTVKSESLESAAYQIPRKRKTRLDSAAVNLMSGNSISSPKKLKSHRPSSVSNPRISEKEIMEDSKEILINPVNLAVKKLSDCLGSKSIWNPRDEEQMRAVKEALHVSKAPSTIVCREDEQSRIFEFVKGCIDLQKAGSLYICGCPGTGKSLSMEKVVQQVGDWSTQAGLPPVDTLSVNCTSLTKTTDIFSKILHEFKPGKKANTNSSPLQHLQNLFSQKQESSHSRKKLHSYKGKHLVQTLAD